MLKGVAYFLPTPGSTSSIMTYTVATKVWGSIAIPASSGVLGMLDGASFAAVEAAQPGINDFLVVSGGRSNKVVSYEIQTGVWTQQHALSNSISNACSTSCLGYWFLMTGDFAKEVGGRRKPANRQVYRYNMTSGEAFENNGEKQRGGAGCGCDEASNRVFWAGGFSDAGVTDDVEVWGADPFHRRGEPEFSTTTKRRDVGGVACGGRFIVAAGDDGKQNSNSVDVFLANSTTGGKPIATYTLGSALRAPRIACLAQRYALISGGEAGSQCNNKVYVLDTQDSSSSSGALHTLATSLPVFGQVAVATDGASSAVFFDGSAGSVISAQ